MRTITHAQRRAIEDLSAEGLLQGLPVQTAEKDIHITELLQRLSTLEVHHDLFGDLDPRKGESTRHDAGIRLVFAGGTCLSKAYGLINRMSEDIDIKVVLEPTERRLKNGQGDRARLKQLHESVSNLLKEMGFSKLPSLDGGVNPSTRDKSRYHLIGAGYLTTYSEFPSLRPELKLELIQRAPLLPLERMEFGYLHEALAELPRTSTLAIDCISVGETAAEKVLSLLRRCAYKWDGHQTDGGIDPALVRHVYDVARIAELRPAALNDARRIFPKLVEIDRQEFRRQNPEFDADPVAVLRRTLTSAKHSADLQACYKLHVMPLVYGMPAPAYEKAFAMFEELAQDLLSAC